MAAIAVCASFSSLILPETEKKKQERTLLISKIHLQMFLWVTIITVILMIQQS